MTDKRCRWFCGFINSPTKKADRKLFDDFILLMSSYCREYYCIIHDKDVDENGLAKTWHFHFVIKTDTVKRDKTVINDLSKKLKIDERLITVDCCYNINKMCRYLCHLDENVLLKRRYDLNEVKTHDFSQFEEYINYADKSHLTVDKIVSICETSDSFIEVMIKVGLANSNHFMNVINRVWLEVRACHTGVSNRIINNLIDNDNTKILK